MEKVSFSQHNGRVCLDDLHLCIDLDRHGYARIVSYDGALCFHVARNACSRGRENANDAKVGFAYTPLLYWRGSLCALLGITLV